MESYKAYNVVREGARNIVRSQRPDLTLDEVEKVLDKLFNEVCAQYHDVEELTACIFRNAFRVAVEVTGRG